MLKYDLGVKVSPFKISKYINDWWNEMTNLTENIKTGKLGSPFKVFLLIKT